MKILYTNFHQNDGGGHVTYILNLARALAPEHDVSIATPASSRLYRYASHIPGVSLIDQVYTSRFIPMVAEVRRLRRFLACQHFDLIHVNGSADHRHIMLATQGLRSKPPIVWTKHNDHPIDSVGNRLRARYAADHVIAVSDYVAGMLATSPYADLPTTVIRHGIDTDYFAPVDVTEREQQREVLLGAGHAGLIVLGSSGGTDYDKGWLDLLAAIAQLPSDQQARFRVIVIGSLPNAEKRRRVDDLGLSELVVFPGLVDDVRPILAACDIGFVLSYREALSFACRETMAMGLPSLVSRVGGLIENVDDGINGWIVPPGDPASIRPILQSILAKPQLIQQMGHAARDKSEAQFGLSSFVTETASIYAKVLSS